MNTYEGYLKNSAGSTLKIDDAMEIYQDLVESVGKCKLEDKMDFWNEFLQAALNYTTIRCKWETMSNAEEMEADRGRSLTHDGFITSVNILSRIAEQEGVDNSWREMLGDERKRIGDFACFVTYITGISNR